jgi:hypothetical protein
VFTIKNNQFVDQKGRIVHLLGVNLGGSSKVPVSPCGATWNRDGFYDTRNVSFVGRPFPLEEADEHLARLKSWGLTFLRFLITWEAIEHAGPGVYDEAYLDYVYQVVKRAAAYDMFLLIDPHQDVWSRFTGGDGAPGWTLDLLGMDITRFRQAGAAFTHQEHGDPLPRMIWPSNNGRYACATLFTLFFGGNTFAPQTRVEGLPVQEFLQSHYIGAVRQVAERLKGFPHVLGYDTMNEPSQGMIGYPSLNMVGAKMASYGAMPTFYQGMLLAAGYTQDVQFKPNQLLPFTRTIRMNAARISIWKPGYEPIWKQHGVWDVDRDNRPSLLKPDYFGLVDGQPVDFDRDFLAPFVEKYIQAIRAVDPDAMIFITPPQAEARYGPSGFSLPNPERIVLAPHWYDGTTMGFQRYLPWIGADTTGDRVIFALGRNRRRRLFAQLIGRMKERGREQFAKAPTVIGETGIPFGLHGKRAYRTGDFSEHIQAMDDTMQAMEANLVSFTLWNYTADNTNAHGDQWNGEDFSIYSRDQLTGSGGINDGGRALDAVIRPYAARIPGEPLRMSFDIRSGVFRFVFRCDPTITAPLVIYLPAYHYAKGVSFTVTRGRVEVDLDKQRLEYYPDPGETLHTIVVSPG